MHTWRAATVGLHSGHKPDVVSLCQYHTTLLQPSNQIHPAGGLSLLHLCAAVFSAADIIGQPEESEEMAPVWIPTQEIPYDRMWADDIYWYPVFLEGRSFQGLFAFTNTHTLVWHRLQELQDVASAAAAELLCQS